MNNIPEDILLKVDKLFSNPTEKAKALAVIQSVFEQSWGVGHAQFARSLLVLSEGNLAVLEEEIKVPEPRDIIVRAEEKSGNPDHYFTIPFTD